MVNILSMGENSVHPLDGVDNNLSIKSIKSILSMPIAPGLHQDQPNQLVWRLDFEYICSTPLLHLYRSQLEILAEHLNLPDEIRTNKTNPDILPGLSDKGDLLGSFIDADQILSGLEKQIPLPDLEIQFGTKKVNYIQTLVRNSAYYRETPYSLL